MLQTAFYISLSLAVVFSPVIALAQDSASANFALEAANFANGGGQIISSSSIIAISVIGQGLVPLGSPGSSSFGLQLGQPEIIAGLLDREEDMRWMITDIFARTQVLGEQIFPAVWQRDDDPYISWGILVEPPELLSGFSIAVDNLPDLVPETTDSAYQFEDDALDSGVHTLYVLPLLSEGIISEEDSLRSFEIWVDNSPPVINSLTPASGVLVDDNKIAVSCAAHDPESGINPATLALTLNGSSQSVTYDAESRILSTASEVFLSEGRNTVVVTAYDSAGNYISQAWEFIADSRPPGGSMQINAGAEVTYSASVSLFLDAEDAVSGVATVFISNDGVFDTELNNGVGYQPVLEDWLLDEPDVDGSKRVFVKFADAAGNLSATYSDEITLRRLTPDTRILSGPDAVTEETDALFTFEATRPGCRYRYTLDGSGWSGWSVSQQAVFAGLAEGNHYFFVKSAYDLNGDGEITPDEEDPTPAQWVWTIGEAPTQDLIEEKTLYYKR
ncbi:MAG: hypothetical protein MJA29_07780 [Candidatus Omnitrophica bacterium]|nr:hypothetical protein [Candidatus Omnitrophota bacterium]